MTAEDIASAMQRVRATLTRRGGAALHTDDPAVARWEQGTRVVSCHASGASVATDMPRPLGGEGAEVTPGWLLRAAMASCLATRIAMEAAARGIDITRLEVAATSESDARGLLGMTEAGGEPVSPAPRQVQLEVRVAAPQAAAETLRSLIEDSNRCSPVTFAVSRSVPVSLRIEIDPA